MPREKKAKVQKPKKEKVVKEKPIKPEKPPKMQSSAPRRFGAWMLVIFMIAMVLFGIYKVLNAPTERAVERTIADQIEAIDADSNARTKAVAFAEQFVTDYLTYSKESSDYPIVMSQYFAPNVQITEPSQNSQVLYVGTSKVTADKTDVSVDVACRVAYATEGDDYDMVQFATIRVPIRMDKDGNCAVVATPLYISNTNNTSDLKASEGTITNTTDKNTEAIQTTIKNFFDVYYNGKASELKYFVTKNYGKPSTTGLGIKVKDVQSYVNSSGDKWDAECKITIDNNGVIQDQHCYLEIVKGAEGRFYINKLYTIDGGKL